MRRTIRAAAASTAVRLGVLGVLVAGCTAAPPLATSGPVVPGTAAPSTSPAPTATLASPGATTVATAASEAAAVPVNAWALDGSGEAAVGNADLTFSGTFEPTHEAVAFDGASGFGSTNGAGPVITTSSFSVAAWVNLGREVDFATAVSQLGDVAGAFYLGVGEGAWDFAMKTADTNEPGHTVRASSGPAEPDPTAWVHLVGVYDEAAGQIRLYVDGQRAAAVGFTEPWQAEGPLTVGRSQAHGGPSDFWPGAIADVRLFSVAMDDEQVRMQHSDDAPSMRPPLVTGGPVCPSVHGGVCLGPLEAGTYTTRAFRTPLTYTVPDGWANYEDLRGNFLLVPPSGSLNGVDAGTSDYIGVYDGVAPVTGTGGYCEGDPQPHPEVARTPEAMAAWYASHPGLVVEGPEPVTIGGLDGVVLDLVMAEGETGVCRFPDFDGPLVPVLIGIGPADFVHALVDDLVMRLYLLTGPTGEVIAIETNDVPGGDTMESLTQVVEDMHFGTDAP